MQSATTLALRVIAVCCILHRALLAAGAASILLMVATHGVGAETEPDRPTEGRLKFRSGPVCMCAGGLGEKEIREQDWVKRHTGEDFKTAKPVASDNKQEEE